MNMQPQWKGSQPQRFSGGRRILRPQGQIGPGLSFFDAKNSQPHGIRSFSPSPTKQAVHRPHLRIFQQNYKSVTKQIDLRGIKHVQLPTQKQRIRPQRVHIDGGQQTTNQIILKGIKPFSEANKSRGKTYFIEDEFQRKARMYGLQSLRNSIAVTSLGDKPYKYPEYSSNFYHEGGLIAGSTHKPRKNQIINEIKIGTILKKPNWERVVKLQQQKQQRKVLDSIDQWQQTILKQNNPKWNDPETFFDREQAKDQGKDTKKIAKK